MPVATMISLFVLDSEAIGDLTAKLAVRCHPFESKEYLARLPFPQPTKMCSGPRETICVTPRDPTLMTDTRVLFLWSMMKKSALVVPTKMNFSSF